MTTVPERITRTWSTLAWAGWMIRIPPEWRPLEIRGGFDSGKMVIGDAASPILQLKWSRPGRFDPDKWARRRNRARDDAQGGRAFASATGQVKAGVPAPGGFAVLDWRPQARAARKLIRAIWAGWSKMAGLLVEAVVFAQDRPSVLRQANGRVLPSLVASAPDAPAGWAVFEASFRTPPGFDVVGRRFQPGSMAMMFAAKGQHLMLRQAYPRAAALARRDLAGWLRAEPFGPQRRLFYPGGEPQAWTVESFGQQLAGLIRTGRRRLPVPLGWAGRRYTVQAVVQDDRLDRLLLAEHSSARDVGDGVVSDAISQMNWALLEKDG